MCVCVCVMLAFLLISCVFSRVYNSFIWPFL